MYSPPGTHVKVRVGSETGTARVVVRDRGPGVPTVDKELIFDPFSRGRVGRQSRPGFGLGLFIARRVLEAHGGSIFVRPNRSGATFVVELPVPNERRERSAS
jgi:signal transduction histidine kinase